MSDQELDDLFKEASVKYETPYDDKEWDKVAAMLDGNSPPKPGFWNWKIISGLALLLLVSGTLVVTQWDKTVGDSSGMNNKSQASKVASQDDSLLSFEADEKVPDANDVLTKKKSNGSPQEENKEVIKIQPDTLSQSNELLKSTAVNQSASQSSGSMKSKNADGTTISKEESSPAQLSKKPTLTKKENATTANETVSNSTYKRNSRSSKLDQPSPVADDSNKRRSRKTTTPTSVGQQLSDSEEKNLTSSGTTISNGVKEGNNNTDNKESLSTNHHSANNSKALIESQAKGESANPLEKNNSFMSVSKEQDKNEEQNGFEQKEKSVGALNNEDDLVGKQNDNLSSALLSGATLTEEKEEAPADSTTALAKNDSLIKEVKKEEKKRMDSLSKLHRFSLKLALSPDFSSVGYFTPDKAGFNYGLLAEYNITRHWSVTLGGIWSRKIYANTKKEMSGSVLHLTELNGKCRVLDLPLNINYYLTPANAFTLYGSVGLSSYIMFDEDYDYYYTNGTSSYSYTSQYKKGNNEFFKMMNLSIGIQQQLSPRVRLQLEPFIKAPLSGIGGSDLKLVSSGVFFNVKYTFK